TQFQHPASFIENVSMTRSIFTAVVGAILIYMLTRDGSPDFPWISQLSALTPADLAIIILFSSLISSFYGPKLRSRKYYNAGQEHQELYDEISDFIEMDISNPRKNNKELRERLDELNVRRHRLNQSTPQLGGIWYYGMKIWGWTTEKINKSYCLIAPWKQTPQGLYNTIHPCNNNDDDDDPDTSKDEDKKPEEILRKKIVKRKEAERAVERGLSDTAYQSEYFKAS
ncbi:hypothetical protein, partial [Natranaeroarchaeum aerophilus]